MRAPLAMQTARPALRWLSIPCFDGLRSLSPWWRLLRLALMEDGRLDLDDPVTRFLPDFEPRLPDGSAPPIMSGTCSPILRDSRILAGAGRPLCGGGCLDPAWTSRGCPCRRTCAGSPRSRLYYRPGSSWRYSVATDVLGAIIAVVDGRSLADAVATYVTDPLGMHDSAFVVREPERLAVPYADGSPRAVRMDEPHRVEELVFSPARAFDQRSFQSGGGGMVGTAGDFMTFLETLRTGGAPILTRETVELASRNQVGSLREQCGAEAWLGLRPTFRGSLLMPSGLGYRPMQERCRGAESMGIRGFKIRSPSSASLA